MRLFGRSTYTALMAIAIGVSFYTFGVSKAIADKTIYFQVPSGNINCGTIGSDGLDCEIGTNTAKLPAKPKDCNLEWGSRFRMLSRGKAQRACYIDTLGTDPKRQVLGNGKTWRGQGFTCISKPTGLTCKNKDGRGWSLSKNKQQLF
jgi:hypothetical protein